MGRGGRAVGLGASIDEVNPDNRKYILCDDLCSK